VGYETHLFFIGDPHLSGEERLMDGRLVLHRWCQWISAHCPGGVYDGEEEKVADFTRSIPSFVMDKVLQPVLASGRTPVVLLEEWQTAETACQLSDALRHAGARDDSVVFWNANNTYGFERVNWQRLASSVTITAVSRYMRSIIRAAGADACVIPNGISAELLAPLRRDEVRQARAPFANASGAGMFFKMARWDRAKGWTQALDAVTHARDRGLRLVLVGRGAGPTGDGNALADEAETRGLRAINVSDETKLHDSLDTAVRSGADVVSLGFGVSPRLARTLYAASDGVLANSISEPFGLVGLEAMAAGGVAYTGGTGEDYAVTGRNAVVLETLDPGEIVDRWDDLSASAERVTRIRRAARKTAREYVWPTVVGKLLAAVAHQAKRQTGVAELPADMSYEGRSGMERRWKIRFGHVDRRAPAGSMLRPA
jgi:glycosyltransferase involved in cell wall biosynthesis